MYLILRAAGDGAYRLDAGMVNLLALMLVSRRQNRVDALPALSQGWMEITYNPIGERLILHTDFDASRCSQLRKASTVFLLECRGG